MRWLGWPLVLLLFALGCSRRTDASDSPAEDAAVESVIRAFWDVNPTALQIYFEEEQELAGAGWVTSGYVKRSGSAIRRVLDAKPSRREAMSYRAAGHALEPRLPEGMASAVADLGRYRQDARPGIVSRMFEDYYPYVELACPGALGVFDRAVTASSYEDRADSLYDGCELQRYPIAQRDDDDRAFPIVAAVLWSTLEARGGVLPGERFLLRGIASDPAFLHDSYADQRAALRSSAGERGPSPEPGKRDAPPGARAITYPSDGRDLLAWLALPESSSQPAAALIYLHGGFALTDADFEATASFRREGLAVMLPSFRGENGNAGDFELFLGEVDDAAAAVRWMASQPEVDPSRIFVFGIGAGGTIASLLTLHDVPVVHGASAGSIMLDTDLVELREIAPFDVLDRRQTAPRALLGHDDEMRTRHYAFFAPRSWLRANAEAGTKAKSKLVTQVLPLEETELHDGAIEAYLDCIRTADACPVPVP